MKDILPGIYQLTRGGNFFLLETAPDELTLVDTGIPGSTSMLLDAIRQLGKRPAQLKHILITHADIDHVGSLAGIVAATGAQVYAGEKSKPYIEKAEAPPHLPALFAWIAAPLQKLFQKKASVNTTVTDGTTLSIGGGIDVIAAPGHTPDNITFFWKERKVLFAADLLNTQSGTLGLTPAPITWDMDAARDSARTVIMRQPRVICVGHGDAVQVNQQSDQVNALLNRLNVQVNPAGFG